MTVYDDAAQGVYIGSNRFSIHRLPSEDAVYQYRDDDSHTFSTQGSPRLRIDTDGKVGIGTTSPGSVLGNSRLDVANGHILVDNDYGIFSANIAGNGPGAGVDTETDDDLSLYAGGASQMTVKADGKLGIGTSDASAQLDVRCDTTSSNGNNTAMFMVENIGPYASRVHYGASGDWYIRSAAESGKVVLQDAGGNVGVGTNGPQAKLHVGGAARFDGPVTIPTSTRYLSLPPIAFTHIENARVESGGVGDWLVSLFSPVGLNCRADVHVQFPHGAVITELRAFPGGSSAHSCSRCRTRLGISWVFAFFAAFAGSVSTAFFGSFAVPPGVPSMRVLG